MILDGLSLLPLLLLANLRTSRSACSSLVQVVHVCSNGRATGDVVYLDTSLTYAMTGSCTCRIDVDGGPLDVNISVESYPEKCHSLLDFTALDYIVKCNQPLPTATKRISETVYVTWIKDRVYKSTDVCVQLKRINTKQAAGQLSVQCEKGGNIHQSTGNRKVKSLITPKPGSAKQTGPTKIMIFGIPESSLIVGILVAIVMVLFVLGVVVHCSDRRLKRKLAREATEDRMRRVAKIEAIERLSMYPPKRKEVVETKL